MSPQDALIGRAVVGVGDVFGRVVELDVTGVAVYSVTVALVVVGFFDGAACACTASRETPAIAARAIEPFRLVNLRNMTCFLWSE